MDLYGPCFGSHHFTGVEVKFRNAFYEVLICPSSVPELNSLEITDKGLVIGGSVTLTEFSKKLEELVASMPGKYGGVDIITVSLVLVHRTGVFTAMLEMLRWFAGQQIRNVSVSNLSLEVEN